MSFVEGLFVCIMKASNNSRMQRSYRVPSLIRYQSSCLLVLCAMLLVFEPAGGTEWLTRESDHFRIIYRENHAHLVGHILQSGELALERLRRIFNYSPSEKITINTYDVNDYGSGAATTVPVNYIWLDLAPLEPGYENIPYNERIRWLLTHELVHIVLNDHATHAEAISRSLFSKVAPEQVEPLSILYSVLTNFSRYTPRWHQEGIAVFLETWLSGGYGRAMGSFDEMYFRSLVDEGTPFPNDIRLETRVAHNSFLVETNYYLYGERLAIHLVNKYGPQKLLEWYKVSPGDFYITFTTKFEQVFGCDFDDAWDDFVREEMIFQQQNINRLKSAPLSPVRRLSSRPIGAVSQPYADSTSGVVYWGEHRPHHLADIQRFNLATGTSEEIATLKTPSMHQVASTAFDAAQGLLFFTTNNNQLYRDIHVLDVRTGTSKELFADCRTGHLTISSRTHELWGIRHQGGGATLVLARQPYDSLQELLHFDIGDEVQGLSISPSGETLAAVLHKADGEQMIVLADAEKIKQGREAEYTVVTRDGSPENPSWGSDSQTLFWDAYTNGVSNIYRTQPGSGKVEAVSHTIRGLFKPVQLGRDSLFAFEFSTDGFIPVIIPNSPAARLPAIHYFGQEVQDKFPSLTELALKAPAEGVAYSDTTVGEEYNGFDHLNVVSFIPVLTGFQTKKVLGLFAHISDPILNHDAIIEIGVSPFRERHQPVDFHMKLKYDYEKEYEFGWDFNSPDFYDLFNSRKRGMLGNKIRFGNIHYWLYDNPHKVKQLSEIALYTGVEFISDNLVRVSQPDFFVTQTGINSQSLRRTIGSSDFESGNEVASTAMVFGSDPKNLQLGYQVWAEWDHFTPYIVPHNVAHFKLAAGYHRINTRLLQSRFYFGGFGNRAVENVDAKQFRKVFRFPGLPIYSFATDRFVKVMFENNFPPVRFSSLAVSQHFLNHLDFSFFSQGLISNSRRGSFAVDVGAQVNLVFKHWFNLETTLSAGIARAWVAGRPTDEWFISYKLLRN